MAHRPSKKPTLLVEQKILDQHPLSENKVSESNESKFIGPSPEAVVNSSLIGESRKPDPIDEMEAELNYILAPLAKDSRLIFEERYDNISPDLKYILAPLSRDPKLLSQDWSVPIQVHAAQRGLPEAQPGSGNPKKNK